MIFFRHRLIIIISLVLLFQPLFTKNKDEIKTEINKLLTNKKLKYSNYSIRVISRDKRETLVSINESIPLAPASTIKILTTSTALSKLSKNFQIKTFVMAENNPNNGIIRGNLFIKGCGNPLLSFSDLENLGNIVYEKGIRTIDGDIVVDDSYFDNKLNRTEWIDTKENNYDEESISPVTVDYNHIGIVIHSSAKIKSTPEINYFPNLLNIKLINRLKVAKISKRKEIVDISFKESGNNYTLTVDGKVRPQAYKYYSVRIKNPSYYIGSLFKSILIRKGITVTGDIKIAKVPFRAYEIAEHRLALDSLIKIINKHSDNFCADHLLKILGAELISKPATANSGISCIYNFLKENNIDTSHYKIYDGSGLSKRNKLTTYALSQILYNISINNEIFNEFYNSLSIAGVDGTLRHRMTDLISTAKVRGKTGTLNNVTSLAGYAYSEDGELLIYTIFMNDFRKGVWDLRKLQDKIISIIAEFSRFH